MNRFDLNGASAIVTGGASGIGEASARQLARIGALFAQVNHGELFALHVIRVPPQMGVSDGRAFLR